MARSLHILGANDDVLLVTYLDHGVMYVYIDQLQLYSINCIRRRTNRAWELKTLEIKWRIRPRSCKMYDPAIPDCISVISNFIQRLFRGFPKSEDSCRDQPVRRHRLVFT